jgi:type I restriction enzyme S subunit
MKLHSDTYDSYRKAEGEWSETIPSEWQEMRVKDLFRLVTQAAPANNDYELLSLFSGIGVRPRKDMEARGNKASSTDGYWIVKKNDIVVNKLLAWMGSVGISEYEGVTSPAYDVLRQVKPDIDPRYYSYLFRTEMAKKIFRKKSRGIMDMRLRLYFDKLGAITVPVPSFHTQESIANYLDQKTKLVDAKIELINKKITAYKRLSRSLITNTVNVGLRNNDNPICRENSFSGKAPEHWNVSHLKRLADIKGGKDSKSVEVEIGGYPVFGSGGVFSRASKYLYSKPSVLLGRKGTIDKPLFVNEPFWSVDTMYYTDIKRDVDPKFFYYKCLNIPFDMYLYGSAVPSMSAGELNKILLSYPDKNEQNKISSFLDEKTKSIGCVISNLNAQVSKLKELRLAVINDAVNGRIKVTASNVSRELIA